MIGRKHVPAHLWADLDRLPPARARALEAHADGCETCAQARARILEAKSSFSDLAAAEAPELEWDHIGARIHWSRSLERRTGERQAIEIDAPPPRRPGRLWIGATAAMVAVATAVLWVFGPWPGKVPLAAELSVTAIPDARALEAVAVELAEARALPAMLVMARGEVLVNGELPQWDEPVAAGSVIETGDGAVALQFGKDSGLSLGARSRLELRSFDSQSVELLLDGLLDVQVSTRGPGQQFVVVAGPRSVTVRGTGFRVEHRGGDLDVACEHGRVDVTDGVTSRAVPARVSLSLAASANLLDDASIEPLGDGELETLATALTLPLLPAWSNAKNAFESSSMLSVTAPTAKDVRIDGASLGRGSVAVRLLSGRHQVMVGTSGQWGAGRWVELDGGAGQLDVDTTASVRLADADRTSARIQARRRELRALLGRTSRLRRCVGQLAEHGVAKGTFARFEVGVNADGSFSFVNIASSNVGLEARACLLDALGSLSLEPGPAARLKLLWRYQAH